MTRIHLENLIWNYWNREHIRKHNVLQQEVEEAIKNIITHRTGYNGRIILTGKSGKRLISVVVYPKQAKKYYIVTARDAEKKERRMVYEKEKQNTKV